MQSATASLDLHAGGMSFSVVQQREDEGGISQSVTLDHGHAGVMGTDGADRTVTTTENHGLEVADVVDVYWTDAGVLKVWYGETIKEETSTKIVELNAVGAGDALPDDATAVIISLVKEITVVFDGDDVSMIAAYCEGTRCHMNFNGPDAQIELTEDIPCFHWMDGMGWTNPLTGVAITTIDASTADIVADRTLNIGGLYDSA